MATVIAQVVLQGQTGLPEDRYVNTLHYWTPADPLASFNDVTSEAYGNIVTAYQIIDGNLIGINNDATVRFYDFDDDEPREPTIVDFSITSSNSQGPYEVACCLSYFSERNLPHEFNAHHDHPGHPEEQDVKGGDQCRSGIILLELECLIGPAEGRERPQSRGEPCIKYVGILDKVVLPAPRTLRWSGFGNNGFRVGADKE